MKRPLVVKFVTDPVVLVGAVMLVGLLLRLRGVTWGLPYLYDPDEHFFVDPAVRMVTTGDLNPRWFGHPGSTVMYVLGLVYGVYWIVGHFAGWFPDLQSFATLFSTNPASFYLLGRVVAVGLAALAIPLTYVLCRKVAGTGAALAAAALVAVSPLHVEFSRIVRTDPLMTTFLVAAMIYGVKAIETPRGKHFLVSGIFIGLATATKYPAIIGAGIVMMAAVLAQAHPAVPLRERARWLALASLGGLIGFFGGAPFVATAVREVYWVMLAEGRQPHLGATGSPGLANYLWYLKGPLREAVGLPLELMALAGFAASCSLRRRPRLLVAAFSALFLLGIGLSVKRFDRWIVPLTPFVAILAGIGAETIVRALAWLRARPMAREAAAGALGVALAFPCAVEAFHQGTTLDTRDIAKAWIEGHVPRGSKVFVEQYTPAISRDAYEVFVVARGNLQRDMTTSGFKGVLGDMRPPSSLREKAIDFAVLSTIYYNRFQADRANHPDEVRLYDELFGSSDVVYEVRPTGRTRGPVIRVLKLRQ